MRQPRLGDFGTIVEIVSDTDGKVGYLIECADIKGNCIWLSDFKEQELEKQEEIKR